MARPTKLTPEVQEKILRAIRAGNQFNVAALSAGISESTFFRWMELGRSKKSGIHRDFYEAVRQAEAESEAHAVAVMRKATTAGQWRAALALLERRHGWGKRERPPAFIEERQMIDPRQLTDKELSTLEKISARTTDLE